MSPPAVLRVAPLGFPWHTSDPFLFCAFHDDAYPVGNEGMAPAASLAGRNIGMDFAGKDGWNMYHGTTVPGFPQHPHRGFETVTLVRRGAIDHSDSLGAAARFGAGDVQWITAGSGLNHSEMFPLLSTEEPNPLELFQIWLNLPAARKMATPHFSMFWSDDVPQANVADDGEPTVEVTVVAGALGELAPPPPPPESWASDPANEVAIWTLEFAPDARWRLPAASAGVNRTLYVFGGDLRIDDVGVGSRSAATLVPDAAPSLAAGSRGASALLLQGRPIDEPVVSHGPFVMNSVAEIQQAIRDYQRTGFGGWPWKSPDPVHARDAGRFARHADGRVERAPE